MRNPDLVAFMLRKAKRDPETGCLLVRAKPPHGYGELFLFGVRMKAHRAIYMAAHGRIDSSVYVLHRCDVRNCVEPTHLFAGTHVDNMADMKAKGRGSKRCDPNKGDGNGMARLGAEQVRALRARAATGEPIAELAGELRITERHVYNIIARKRWAHIE